MHELLRRPAVWIGFALLGVLVGAAIGFAANRPPTPTAISSEQQTASGVAAATATNASSISSSGSTTPEATSTERSTTKPTKRPTPGATSTARDTAKPTPAPTKKPAPKPPATPRPTAKPATGTAVLVGAGDIAKCGALDARADAKTANLLASIPGTIFTAGDNAYSDGSTADFACFDQTWGRFTSRMLPSPGNHDYHIPGAAGYFAYFADRIMGDYYAFTVGAWRVYSLDSENVTPGEVAWLKSDLAAHAGGCTMAYWHHPRFSSGMHGNDHDVQPFWDALSAAGAELVINGHDHNYERFAPQTATGAKSGTGIREIVVGTGGAGLRPLASKAANSEVFNGDTHGVIKLTLGPGTYSWQFVPADGVFFRDSGSGTCH
jgi:acid phosphatase type 7